MNALLLIFCRVFEPQGLGVLVPTLWSVILGPLAVLGRFRWGW